MNRSQSVLAALATGPKTPAQIAKMLGDSIEGVHQTCKRLKERGIIERKDSHAGTSRPNAAIWDLIPDAIIEAPNYNPNSPWTDEALVLRAAALWKAGQSGGSIAKTLGRGLTRASVIGKMVRCGLGRENPTKPNLPKGGELAVARTDRRGAIFAGNARRAEASAVRPPPPNRPPVPPAPETAASERPNPIPLLSLTNQTCKWPVNSPRLGEEYLFCGARSVTGRPYCCAHERRSAGERQYTQKQTDRLARLGAR
jgi:GcrA cell cycle regulator